jgi:nicotinate-nucleotide pyrophosphorylase
LLHAVRSSPPSLPPKVNTLNGFYAMQGSITDAIQTARAVGGFTLLIDVEVRSEAEANEAVEAGADIVMLDNMEGEALVSAARRLKDTWRGRRKFLVETSGGITEANLQERAINGRQLGFHELSSKL